MRPLRLDRTFPAGHGAPDEVLTRLQLGLFRVGTVLAGTAPAFGRALAPCYGSSLLTLRLLSDLQLGDAGWRRRPKRRRFDGLCRARSLPAFTSSLRASLREEEAFWRGGPAGQRACVLVCAVAAVTLWVTASAHGSKRSVNLTRRGGGFCFAPSRTAPDSWQLARSRHRPEELVICACWGACASRGEEGTSCPLPFPGHPGLSQSPCGGFFMPPWSRLFYQGTRLSVHQG